MWESAHPIGILLADGFRYLVNFCGGCYWVVGFSGGWVGVTTGSGEFPARITGCYYRVVPLYNVHFNTRLHEYMFGVDPSESVPESSKPASETGKDDSEKVSHVPENDRDMISCTQKISPTIL